MGDFKSSLEFHILAFKIISKNIFTYKNYFLLAIIHLNTALDYLSCQNTIASFYFILKSIKVLNVISCSNHHTSLDSIFSKCYEIIAECCQFIGSYNTTAKFLKK